MRASADPVQSLEPVANVSDVLSMQHAVAQIKVDSSLHDYALEIVAAPENPNSFHSASAREAL